MHHFLTHTLQWIVITIYLLMVLSTTTTMVKAVIWANRTGKHEVRWLPRKLDWGYTVLIAASTVAGVKLYQYWGWDVLANVTYYGLIPLAIYATFSWINTQLFVVYKLDQFAQGKHTLFARAFMAILRLFNNRTPVVAK